MAQNPYSQFSPQNTYNYYNPSNDYGGGVNGWHPGAFQQTPLGHEYLENNQEASFTRWLADNGFRDFTGEGEFARQQFGRVQTGHEAALATNPDLTFQNYLQDMGGQGLRNQYHRLTPEQRGESVRQYSPRARYIPR